jgi:hypothetical protein
MDWIELPHEPCHLGVPPGASKMIPEPLVCLAQTMHLSCTETRTIAKWTESSIHLSPSPRSTFRCIQNDFLSLWYIRRKPCTYLVSRLALSLNELNQASTWASLPRSTIECVQNHFWAYGTFGVNRVPILHQHQHSLQMDQNDIPPGSSIRCIQNDFRACGTFGANQAPILRQD